MRKDFGYLVKAAIDGEPDLNIFAVGEELSWNQYLKTWCESQNVPFGGYDEVAYDDFTVLLPGGLGHEFGQNVLFAIEFGYDGSDPSVTRPDSVSHITPLLHLMKLIIIVWYQNDHVQGVLRGDRLLFHIVA